MYFVEWSDRIENDTQISHLYHPNSTNSGEIQMNATNELSPIEKDYIESFQNAMEDELRRLRLRKRRKSLLTKLEALVLVIEPIGEL